ncbi:hypothetical protein [Streptomyces tubercidicus]|uniref:hypothetical protein n=1 Tax=Streptomyces tubercidicus TaxID=47759 RepID=UPI003466F5FE
MIGLIAFQTALYLFGGRCNSLLSVDEMFSVRICIKGERPVSDGFKADLQELGLLARKLDQSAESMRRASQNLKSASIRDLGNISIDESAADFKESWEYGIEQIAKMSGALREGLHATARAYSETDSAIQQALSKGQHSGSGNQKGAAATAFG